MNFALKDIELYIDDLWVEQGEALLLEFTKQKLHEIERHLWVGTMGDSEIEVQISPSKVKAYTCECDDFKREKICSHVTAGLLYLRKLLQQKEEEKKAKAVPPKATSNKLTIPLILRSANDEELRQFIRQYARINRDFALSLKARFAARIDSIDSHAKYEQLLDAIIKPGTSKKRKMTAKTRTQLLRLLDELEIQAKDSLAIENPTETFAISQAALDKAGSILRWPSDKEVDFPAIFRRFIRQLLQIQLSAVAPALKVKIFDYLLDLCFTPTLLEKGLSDDLIQFAIEKDLSSTQRQQILERIDILLASTQLEKKYHLQLLVNKLRLLELEGRSEEQEALIKKHLNEPNVLLHAIDRSLRNQQYSQVQKLAERGLNDYRNTEILAALREALLSVALHLKDKKETAHQALWLFLHHYQIDYFRQYKSTFRKSSWPKAFQKLLTTLDERPFSLAKRDMHSDVFVEEQKPTALYEYIHKIRSMDLLLRHGQYLFQWDEKKTNELYTELLENYISNHIGRQTSQKVRRLIQHLHEINQAKVAARLVAFLRQEYGERDSLMDELAVFR